jgi:probable blue pigment (indigoidine) exporter
MLVTAIAPIAWGSNYYVTRQFLPSGYPLYGAAVRALPAGLTLLAIAQRRPHGSWWWKSAVLGVLNVGAFFVLIYLAAQLLPSSIASTLMALSAVVMMLLAWVALAERPQARSLAGALVGLVGVAVMLLSDAGSVNPLGVLASVAAMIMSSVGYILTKRWAQGMDTLAVTSWQLIAGGLLVLPVAVVAEGHFPPVDPPALIGFAYVSLVATALAFTAWFAGLRRLDVATVGLIGLLNPVTGVVLGSVVASEAFGPREVIGAALVIVGVTIGQRRSGRRGRSRVELGPVTTPVDPRITV